MRSRASLIPAVLCLLASGICLADGIDTAPRVEQPEGPNGVAVLDVTGMAPAYLRNAQEEAKQDAFRRAVEQGGGIYVQSQTQVNDFQLAVDSINTISNGFILDWKPLVENPNQDGMYVIRIRARVQSSGIRQSIDGLKQVIARKGYPRVLVVSSTEGRALADNLAAQVQETLLQRGFKVISWGMLDKVQRDDAEQAARGELNVVKAAAIASQVKADYFLVVASTVQRFAPTTSLGITTYPLDISCHIDFIARDTAMLGATAFVDAHSNDNAQPEQTIEHLRGDLTAQALKKAIGNMAQEWLEELKQTEIEVSLYMANEDTVNHVARSLRKIKNIQGINIHSIDEHGFSELRVMTRYNAGDLMGLLKDIDPSIPNVKTSPGKISIDYGGFVAPPPGRHFGFVNTILWFALAGLTVVGGLAVAVINWLRHRAEDFKAMLPMDSGALAGDNSSPSPAQDVPQQTADDESLTF